MRISRTIWSYGRFSANCRRNQRLTASDDGTVRLWHTRPIAERMRTAEAALAREAGAVLLVAAWGFAALLEGHTWTRPVGRPFQATVLQGNIPQDLTWAREQHIATVDLYTRLTREHQDSRVVVWPETAIPAFYHEVEDSLLPELQRAAEKWNLDLITGIPVRSAKRASSKAFRAVSKP